MIECDVLVVGCGPAGASAARAAATMGAKVICIDKKKEVGVPVQCAEGIGSYLFPYLPFKIPKHQLKWRIDGIRFWVDGVEIERKGGFWTGYTINRKLFDLWLSHLAKKAGARIVTGTEFVSLDKMSSIHCISKGRNIEISAKAIVAADGSESRVLKELGEYNPKPGDVGEVYSWEMNGVKLGAPNLEQIYAGEFAPGGYGYIFPKSKKSANVGVGIPLPKKDPQEYFEQFFEISSVKKQLGRGKRTIEKSKKEIWGDVSKKWIYDNVIVVGDAANQNLKPFIEGILPAVISGNIAGELACLNASGQGVQERQYRNELKKRLGQHFDASAEAMAVIEKIFRLKGKSKYVLFTGFISQVFGVEKLQQLEACTSTELKRKLMELA